MNRLNYDYGYVNSRPNGKGYSNVHLSTSVKPDTYINVYDTHRRPQIGLFGATLIVFLILMCGWGLQRLIFY